VSLTTAIENLARQAGLNYILDPKVTFGQPGPNGQPAPQPNINLRWENLTAGQALSALLTTYSLQLVEDPNTGVARITVKDPAAPEPLFTKIIQLKYAAPSNVLASVQSTFTDKRSKVVADVRTSQLVVVATDKEQRAVEELIDRLDTPDKQVLIEGKILETTVNPQSIKGIDWSGTFQGQHFAFGNNLQTGPVTADSMNPPLATQWPKVMADTARGFNPATAFLDADGVNAVLSFLNSSSDTKVVSEPRMVTLDNQKATIDVGLMYPIVNTTASTVQVPGGSQISYSNLTVNLDVTPRITADNYVELKVEQHILRLGPTVSSKVNGNDNEVNSFFTRRMQTSVLIPQGNTLVMGGLISDEQTSGNKKVPVLGDIPVLGYMFRQDSKERNRQNLLVFITPSVVGTNDFQVAHSTFLKTSPKTGGANEAKEDWSWWDSGKPASYDWSKPEEEPVYQ
jgi:type II secretory pathway component GspD/PulD (secretin)